jgi:hypothetical protein
MNLSPKLKHSYEKGKPGLVTGCRLPVTSCQVCHTSIAIVT